MANPFEVQTINPLQALLVGGQAYDGARKSAREEQQKSVLAQLLGGGGQPGQAPDFSRAASSLAASGDLDGAVKVATLGKAFSPESSADIQAFKMAQSQGFKGGILDFMKQKAEAGATKVSTSNNISTGGGGSDKQIFDTVDESYKSARTAATGLAGLSEAKKALDGGIVSGAGADARLGLQKVGAFLGVSDPTSIQNTETFRAAIAPQVAAMIKATVGTANISNSDREFAQKAAGENINLDAGSIRRLVDIMERAGTGIVKGHNERLDAVYPNDPKFKRERALFSVPMQAAPSAAAPQQPSSAKPQAMPRRAPDGNLYVPDPDRPGKYLQVIQ